MRIVIATGIFAPESGGPAVYAPQLARELVALGDEVTVVTYSNVESAAADAHYPFRVVRVRRGNKFLNRVRYFFAVASRIAWSDCVYLLDWFAAGVPAAFAARLLRKPYAVRIGGDYLWEQRYLESGQAPLSLTSFYERGFDRARAYRPFRTAIYAVLRNARMLVFNAARMRDLYATYYDLAPENMRVIENPVPVVSADATRDAPNKEIVFWGRLIEMKNIATLLRAFANAALPSEYTLTIIGDGPQKTALMHLANELGINERVRFEPALPNERVLARVRNARAFVLPSWTDISPNQVYEALALKLPALVTRENYLGIHDQLPEMFDPASVDELTTKLQMLADEEAYSRFTAAFSEIRVENAWPDVARAHHELFSHLV